MNRSENSNWSSQFYLTSPLFYPLMNTQFFFSSFATWPSLDDYNLFISTHATTSKNNIPIRFVRQDGKPQTFEQHYEPRIFLNGEIQTRENNWHDFFQVLVWHNFPNTKSTLNHLHYKEAIKRNSSIAYQKTNASQKTKVLQKNRSPIENAITLFDECGSIIVCCNEHLLQLIDNADWEALFWDNRELIQSTLKIFVFGHALYEKALNPYIGMTSHSILLSAPESFFSDELEQQLSYLDHEISLLFEQGNIQTPKALTPIPVLGYPGWHIDNNNENFYANKAYFRKRKQRPYTVAQYSE